MVNIARGGAKSVPYGLHSEFLGGHVIDEEILQLAVRKSGISLKDASIIERLRRNAPEVLLQIEQVKIELSEQYEINGATETIERTLTFDPGIIAHNKVVTADITCFDLEKIV